MTHVRADRSSYDHWAADGASGWGFDDLLPYFRRAENALGRDPHLRGTDGPLTVEPNANPHPAAEAFFAACRERGYPVSDDLNGAHTEGVCWFDQNIVDGRRQSAADAYLRPALDRPNLTVLTDAPVTGLTFTGTSCTGVQVPARTRPVSSPSMPNARSSCAPEPSDPRICCCSRALVRRISFADHGIDVVARSAGRGCQPVRPSARRGHLLRVSADDTWRAQHRRRGGRVPRRPRLDDAGRAHALSGGPVRAPGPQRPRRTATPSPSACSARTAADRCGWPRRTRPHHR